KITPFQMIMLATKGVPVFSLLRCMDGRVKPGHDEKPKGATRTLLEQGNLLNPQARATRPLASRAAWRQHDLHAAVDVEGLGHGLVYLIDRKFMGDELVERKGLLEGVQKTQAGGIAGRGMVGHAEQADLVGEQMAVGIDRD